jgi:UDP-N-acetylglucosamine transferase subunit ALG13
MSEKELRKKTKLTIPVSGCGLFLSSSGGHFSELVYIARKFDATKESQIITFDSSDTLVTSLEFDITYLPYVAPRKILPLVRIIPRLNRILNRKSFDYIASTGAAIAIIAYVLAKLRRKPFYYVESFARQSSFSLTTKILKIIGLKHFFVQSEGLASAKYMLIPNPINSFRSTREIDFNIKKSLRIFVALGTIRDFEFPRAIDLVKQLVNETDLINWQLGFTKYENLPGKTYSELDRDQFIHLIVSSDIIICHAGIGILTDCFSVGKKPLVIPRRGKYHEHVDDHQVEMMKFLLSKQLVIDLEANQSRDLFKDALSYKVLAD